MHLLNRRSYTNLRAVESFLSLLSVKYIILQIFRPVQPVVLAGEDKTGFGSLIEEATLTGEQQNIDEDRNRNGKRRTNKSGI